MRPFFFKVVACQTAALLQDTYALTYPDRLEVRLMVEIGEASCALSIERKEKLTARPLP